MRTSAGASRLRGWLARVPLTREGLAWFVIAAGLLLVGLLKGINLVTLLASLLVVLVVWNGWQARRQLRPIRVEPWDDEPAFAQTPFQAAVRLSNPGRRSVGGIDVRTGAGPLCPRWYVSELAAHSAIVLRAEIVYPRRGRVDAQALTIASGYPLGLVRFERTSDAPPRIVLPRLGQLHRARLRRFLSRRSPNLGQTRSLPSPSRTAQAEFHGLRPYRPGDSPRNVHWRTSARRGELMVREFEDWPNDDLTIVLEARTDTATDNDPRLELAISLAATVCWEWCRQTGDRLILAVAGSTVSVDDGPTCRTLARRMLERLALEPGSAAIDAERLAAALHERRLSTGPILVISPRDSDLGARLQQRLHRRVAVVAVDSAESAAFFEACEDNSMASGAASARRVREDTAG